MFHINIDYILIWSVVVGVISVTIAKGRPFKEVRGYLLTRHKFTGQMVACPYCLSHYVAAAAALYLMITLKLSLMETFLVWPVLIAGAGLVGMLMVLYLWVSKLHSLLIAESRKKEEQEKSTATDNLPVEQVKFLKSAEIKLIMALTKKNLEALGVWPFIPVLLKSDIANNRDLETMNDIPNLQMAFKRAGLPAFDHYSHSGDYQDNDTASHTPYIGWECDTAPVELNELVVRK